MAKNKCEHIHVMYDKVNDYNYCQDCSKIFTEEEWLINIENNNVDDEIESNLSRLNNL